MEPLTPTEDIRAARHRLAAKFGNDLGLIAADLRRQQAESDAQFVTLPSHPAGRTTNNPLHRRHLSHLVKGLVGVCRIFFKR